MEVEDRLSRTGADIHDDAIVVEASLARRIRDEPEHSARLLVRKLGDLPKRLDMTLREHEEMDRRLRVDVPNCDEAVLTTYVLSLADEPAEDAVRRRHRGSRLA